MEFFVTTVIMSYQWAWEIVSSAIVMEVVVWSSAGLLLELRWRGVMMVQWREHSAVHIVIQYRQTSNISRTKCQNLMFLLSSCSCLCQIHRECKSVSHILWHGASSLSCWWYAINLDTRLARTSKSRACAVLTIAWSPYSCTTRCSLIRFLAVYHRWATIKSLTVT